MGAVPAAPERESYRFLERRLRSAGIATEPAFLEALAEEPARVLRALAEALPAASDEAIRALGALLDGKAQSFAASRWTPTGTEVARAPERWCTLLRAAPAWAEHLRWPYEGEAALALLGEYRKLSAEERDLAMARIAAATLPQTYDALDLGMTDRFLERLARVPELRAALARRLSELARDRQPGAVLLRARLLGEAPPADAAAWLVRELSQAISLALGLLLPPGSDDEAPSRGVASLIGVYEASPLWFQEQVREVAMRLSQSRALREGDREQLAALMRELAERAGA